MAAGLVPPPFSHSLLFSLCVPAAFSLLPAPCVIECPSFSLYSDRHLISSRAHERRYRMPRDPMASEPT